MRRLAALTLLAAGCSAAPSPSPSSPTPAATSAPLVTPAPTPAPTPVPTPTLVPLIDAARLTEHVRVLAKQIGVRRPGKPGDRAAADYVRTQFEAAGLQASLVPFTTPAGHETWNVVGMPAGLDVESARYLIVGAHYDTVADSPGGNDNASGTAVVIEIGRSLVADPAPLPVVVVAFGAEEVQPGPKGTHHLGSAAYVAAMSEAARRNLVAMLSVDQVGFNSSFVAGWPGFGPREPTDRIVRVARSLGFRATDRRTPDWSDHGPFLRAGLNAGWLWSGEDKDFHSPRDTFEHVRFATVEAAARIVLAVLGSYV